MTLRTSTVLLGLLLHLASLAAQNRSDYHWIFGNNSDGTLPGTEGTVIDFNQSPPDIYYTPIVPPVAIGNSTAVMSHPETGELLFYSNGCMVLNAKHDTMDNGNEINPGGIHDYYCEETQTRWYPNGNALIALDDAYNTDEYYLLHQPRTIDEDFNIYCDRMLYSKVDMTADGGLGSLVEKSVPFDSDESLQCGSMTAIRYANGKDWWVVQPAEMSNQYHTYLIDEDGSHLDTIQTVGEAMLGRTQAAFSPQGDAYGIFSEKDGYQLFDFDRSTGLLTYKDSVVPQEGNVAGGMAFSPSGQFSYVFYREELYQIDNDADVLSDGLLLVDTLTPNPDGFPTSFFYSMLGPDCRIYITHRNTTGYLGRINAPDEKGLACDFVQRDVSLTYFHDIAAIPNVPHFRVDEDAVCDPSISTGLMDIVPFPNVEALSILPNPSSDFIRVDTELTGTVKIIDAQGRLIHESTKNSTSEVQIDIHLWPSGIYYLVLQSADGRRANQKFVKN